MDYQLGPGPLQVDQNTIDEKIKGDIGIVENGDVATHAIPSGYYVIWKGDLYVAKTDISSGTTLSTSNLTAKPNGLGAEVAALNSKTTTETFACERVASVLGASTIIGRRIGNLCILTLNGIFAGSAESGWKKAIDIDVTVNGTFYSVFNMTNRGACLQVRATNSQIDVYSPPGGGNDCLGEIVFICS